MERRILVVSLTLMTIVGCSNKYDLSKSEKEQIICEVDSIYDVDQGNRKVFYHIDSIYGLNKGFFMNRNRVSVLKEKLGSTHKHYKKSLDSLVDVISICDSLNTKRIMEITKNHGFPSNERLGTYKAKSYMILVHSPRSFFSEVEDVIKKEYSEGRISEYKKEYIFWHIKGRKGSPPYADKKR